MPVEAGAGTILIETGTPLWSPTPDAATGRWIVVSNRNQVLRQLAHNKQTHREPLRLAFHRPNTEVVATSSVPIDNLWLFDHTKSEALCRIRLALGRIISLRYDDNSSHAKAQALPN
jgi:predicted neuraminidase